VTQDQPQTGSAQAEKPSRPHKRGRILSGHRPTGMLHLGHLVGALSNWVDLQDEHDCLYTIVDWHALTTHYADTSDLQQNILEVAIDWLAAGLDPERSTLFVQSNVPEHAELHLLLSMLVPVPWLERVPSYKEQQLQLTGRDLTTYGFLGYPVLQAADIVLYDATLVPVGEDQLPHIELTRAAPRCSRCSPTRRVSGALTPVPPTSARSLTFTRSSATRRRSPWWTGSVE